jgi:hypothetical protein
MSRVSVALLAAALSLAACSGGVSRTVDSPPIDVRAALAANAGTLGLADQLTGVSHSSEVTEQGITWHFTVNGQDYARYVITIADRPVGSKVSAYFEEVDGPSNSAVPFLRQTARALSDEVLLATLEKRPIDANTLKRVLIATTVRDPTAVAGMQQAIMGEAVNAMQEINSPNPRMGPQAYDRQRGYDKTPTYDRDRVTQYEAERRRAEIDRR